MWGIRRGGKRKKTEKDSNRENGEQSRKANMKNACSVQCFLTLNIRSLCSEALGLGDLAILKELAWLASGFHVLLLTLSRRAWFVSTKERTLNAKSKPQVLVAKKMRGPLCFGVADEGCGGVRVGAEQSSNGVLTLARVICCEHHLWENTDRIHF